MGEIVQHGFRFKEYTGKQPSIFMTARKEERQLTETANLNESVNYEERYSKTFFNKKSDERSLNESKAFRNADNVYDKLSKKLFSNIIGEIFMKAIPLDEDFKEKYKGNIRTLLDENLYPNDEYIFDTFKKIKNNSLFLESVISLIEGCAKNTSNKKLKNKELISDEFELCDDDNEIFNSKKEVLNIDAVSDMIKDKVITVIEKETEESEKHKEIVDELMNKSQDEGMQESFTFIKKGGLEQHTLFKALMINTHKNILKEKNNLSENYISESTEGMKVNMDFVMAESIVRYTLLETLNTLKIIDLSTKEARKLSEMLTYE